MFEFKKDMSFKLSEDYIVLLFPLLWLVLFAVLHIIAPPGFSFFEVVGANIDFEKFMVSTIPMIVLLIIGMALRTKIMLCTETGHCEHVLSIFGKPILVTIIDASSSFNVVKEDVSPTSYSITICYRAGEYKFVSKEHRESHALELNRFFKHALKSVAPVTCRARNS